MGNGIYEEGRGAEMLIARTYLGLQRDEMAERLNVRPQSYQRWENGRDAIPSGIWAEVEALKRLFGEQVKQLVHRAEQGETEVKVWRGRSSEQPHPGWWLRIVSEAMDENPAIQPRFPESDDESRRGTSWE